MGAPTFLPPVEVALRSPQRRRAAQRVTDQKKSVTRVPFVTMLFAAGVWYPWYLAWIWPAVLIRVNLAHRLLAMVAMALSALTLLYTIAPPA